MEQQKSLELATPLFLRHAKRRRLISILSKKESAAHLWSKNKPILSFKTYDNLIKQLMKIKSTVAQCAALIRQDLKEKFPLTKFKVTSENYSMGDCVNVSWIDGAAENEVKELLAKYEYGSFNGMEDAYEINNLRDDIAQTKYLSLNRTISQEIYLAKFEEMKKTWNILQPIVDINAASQDLFNYCRFWTAHQFIYQQNDGFRKIDFSKKPESKPLQQAFNGAVKIVEYSEKAIAIFGDTKPLKDKFKALGGRFNPFLMNNGEKMAGWIFPKTKSGELSQLLNAGA